MFPKKIKACILFLLLTVPAALGAVWCAKHAYRYHLAVHPLPYSPEQGALLEKHRQDKRNARLNPHAPVLFLGSSTMEFWLKEGNIPGKPGFPLWDASTWEPGARPRATCSGASMTA